MMCTCIIINPDIYVYTTIIYVYTTIIYVYTTIYINSASY